MFCRNCGNRISDEAAVCTHCGVLKGDGDRYCPNCGAMPDPRAVICVQCGVSLRQIAVGGRNGAASDRANANVYGFVEAIKRCFSKYADFSGRACRAEYWYWVLLNVIVGTVIMTGTFIIAEACHTSYVTAYGYYYSDYEKYIGAGVILSSIYGLATLLPTLAVFTRRMHDTGRSGLWFLLSCIPFVNFVTSILLLVWCCEDSQPEANRYGRNPKNM